MPGYGMVEVSTAVKNKKNRQKKWIQTQNNRL